MPISADELAARVNSLRASYAQNLPEKLAQIATRVESLSSAWDDELGDEAARFAHNLAGTGQTFGFPTVGQAARRLEDELMSSKEEQAPGASLKSALADLVSAAVAAGVQVDA